MEEKTYKMTLHLDVLEKVNAIFSSEEKKADVEAYFPSQALTKEKLRYYETVEDSLSIDTGIGIDIPVTLHTDKEEKGKIFILAESPQRKAEKCKGKTFIGVPFAVDSKMGVPSRCDVYKLIFKNLLEDGYSLYLSDAIKKWTGANTGRSDLSILKNEIEKVNPVKIIAFGRTARIAVKKMIEEGKLTCEQKIEIPHPSINNWPRWEIYIYAKAIKESKSSQDFQELEKLPYSKMTAEIVAEAAIKDIKEQLKQNQQ